MTYKLPINRHGRHAMSCSALAMNRLIYTRDTETPSSQTIMFRCSSWKTRLIKRLQHITTYFCFWKRLQWKSLSLYSQLKTGFYLSGDFWCIYVSMATLAKYPVIDIKGKDLFTSKSFATKEALQNWPVLCVVLVQVLFINIIGCSTFCWQR